MLFRSPGVGGPCLPVNSVQILHSGKLAGDNLLRMVSLSQEINDGMASHVLDLLEDGLKSVGKQLNDSTVLILGVSYKPNVKDIQITPAESVIQNLLAAGAKIKIYDPYFVSTKIFNILTESSIENGLMGTDAAILITAHNEFRNIDPGFLVAKSKSLVFVDTRGALDVHVAKKAGLIFRGLGRGKI